MAGSVSVTVNTEPTPGLLLATMLPPIMRARWREISSPRPVPPARRRKLLSAWWKRVNRLAMVASSMPTPVSRTVMITPWSVSGWRVSSAITLPSLVNLTALLSRLKRICRRRVTSTMTHSGRSPAV